VSDVEARIRDQALEVGRGWSGPEVPESWALTAALFTGLASDDELLALAAEIPLAKLPALLFVASVHQVVRRHADEPFAAYFPADGGGAQPALGASFAEHYRRFCLAHRAELAEVWEHRYYQMNEVARSVQVALALAVVHELVPERAVALVDVGTGAGLGLLADRYHYRFSDGTDMGDPTSPVEISCELQGTLTPRARRLPAVASRAGIDVDPIDLGDADARAWLTACLPPEVTALARAHGAIELVRAADVDIVRGPALDVLAGALAGHPDDDLLCVIDTYTAVFFDELQRSRFRDAIATVGATRDVAWISLDPLVPLGTDARLTVQGADAPQRLIDRNRHGGVFGVLSLTVHRAGTTTTTILAAAHPSGTRMEWLDVATAIG